MWRLTILVPLLLSACSGEAIGPSLAKRPTEDRNMAEPIRTPVPPAAADAALTAQIAALIEQARAGQRAFAALMPRTQSAVSAAGSEGSESWIAAQQLLSALEGARAPSTRSLAELDAMIAKQLNGGVEAGVAELQAADAEVTALVDAQQRDLDTLRARLSR